MLARLRRCISGRTKQSRHTKAYRYTYVEIVSERHLPDAMLSDGQNDNDSKKQLTLAREAQRVAEKRGLKIDTQ